MIPIFPERSFEESFQPSLAILGKFEQEFPLMASMGKLHRLLHEIC
jgi:hypothetical protein